MSDEMPVFKDRGVVIQTKISENVKVILALYPDNRNPEQYTILAKPVVKKFKKSGNYKSSQMYKTWLSIWEVAALKSALERAVVMMEEYFEGTLDLSHILAADDDARLLVRLRDGENPTIDNMFEIRDDF